jgi:hypothetical protein
MTGEVHTADMTKELVIDSSIPPTVSGDWATPVGIEHHDVPSREMTSLATPVNRGRVGWSSSFYRKSGFFHPARILREKGPLGRVDVVGIAM